MRTGFVSLVGSGPGDPGLLTLKAQARIQQADLIIYDYLANPDHLAHAQKGASVFCVGKGFRHKKLSQDKINRRILSEAKKGHRVVRLKGGDPYLFGRGAEEALFLEKHKVPFEVIPGVTSAVACAAYAGIPMTHRDHNASVTFLTGHRANDRNLDSIDWKKIVDLQGTIAIYMGLYNLKHIAKHLVEGGMSPDTPSAVIEWGTLPRQRSAVQPLSGIVQEAAKLKLKAPAMILIGPVAALSKKLNWYEKLPLFGQKILVTRMKEKASELTSRLAELGADALSLPVIEIQKPRKLTALDRAIDEIRLFDWVMFTSAYGVVAFFDRLNQRNKDPRDLHGIQIAAVGSETVRALSSYGIHADLMPDNFESSKMAHALGKRIRHEGGKQILLPRTNIAPPELEGILKKYGAEVTVVTAYETVLPKIAPSLSQQVRRTRFDWVTFTSSSTVQNFVKILGLNAVRKMNRQARFASIGPVTSRTLRTFKLKVHVEAKTYTLEGLVEAIAKGSRK